MRSIQTKSLLAFLGGVCLLLLPLTAAGGVEVTGVSEAARINKDSIFETFKAGGWVMWPILLCSLVGLAYGVERFLGLRDSVVMPMRLKSEYQQVMEALRGGRVSLKEAGQKLQNGGSSEAEKLFERFLKRDYKNMRDVEMVLQDYIEVTQFQMQKNIKPLGLVAQVSPLLGLFGTVLGMIEAFDVVAVQGLGEPKLFASGMAVALLTTVFGLGVAIPCSIVYHQLMEKSSRMALKVYNMLHEMMLLGSIDETDKANS